MHDPRIDRRTFMKGATLGAAALSTASLSAFPLFGKLARAAESAAGSPTGRCLLIINFAGGFDPLSVLQPDVSVLRDLRPGPFRDPGQLLPSSGQLRLTPEFPLLGELFRPARGRDPAPWRTRTRPGSTTSRSARMPAGVFDSPRAGGRGGWVSGSPREPRALHAARRHCGPGEWHPTVSGGRFGSANVNWQLQTFRNETLREVNALRDAGVFAEDASLRTPS
jgi:hypothetical protein